MGILFWVGMMAILCLVGCGDSPAPAPKESRSGHIVSRSPATHLPLDWWRANHMIFFRQSAAASAWVEKGECVLCHDSRSFCLRCHEYVGGVSLDRDG